MEKKEGYKKTEIGWIPEEWRFKKLKSLSSLITKGTTPTTLGFSYQKSGINFIKVESIDGYGNFLHELFGHISEEANIALKRSILIENDLIFSIAGALGRAAIVSNDILPANTNQALAIIRCNSNSEVELKYLYALLKSDNIHRYIHKICVQSAQANLSLKDVGDMPVPLPPLQEQTKIADILTTVDDKISSIDSQIQQTEQLKKGLMEKLLTEGIGHTEFKETEIGRIPKEWDVVKFGSIIEEYKKKCLKDNEFEVLTSSRKGLMRQKDYYGENRLTERTTVGFSLCPPEYITFRSRSDDGSFVFNQNKLGFTGAISKYYPVFTTIDGCNDFFVSICNKLSRYFSKYSVGSSQLVLSFNALAKCKVPLPPLPEQKKIATIQSILDNKLDILTQKKSHYQTLKKGLSQQLLTGQMRVKV